MDRVTAPERPRDPNQLAKFIVDVATGDLSTPTHSGLTKRAKAGGIKGGDCRYRCAGRGGRRQAGQARAVQAELGRQNFAHDVFCGRLYLWKHCATIYVDQI